MGSARTLVLDGSLGFGIVAIVEERGGLDLCVAENLHVDQPLLQRISALVPSHAERDSLTGVVVGIGPGSYTGIRVAASAAVGIAAALALPLRESASDRALWLAAQRPFSIALGARESLEVLEGGAIIVAREDASPHITQEESRGRVACALVKLSRPVASHVTLRYPASARGNEAQ